MTRSDSVKKDNILKSGYFYLWWLVIPVSLILHIVQENSHIFPDHYLHPSSELTYLFFSYSLHGALLQWLTMGSLKPRLITLQGLVYFLVGAWNLFGIRSMNAEIRHFLLWPSLIKGFVLCSLGGHLIIFGIKNWRKAERLQEDIIPKNL